MARRLRYIPPNALVEVTCRTIQARYLLRPSRDLNEIVIGVLSRAASRYQVRVCAFVYLSNHCHLLLQPADAEQLAGFMEYLNGNVAREAGRLHAWRERFWSRRYTAIVVSDEEAAQVDRLRYLLSQGCKENLVDSPEKWPGASSVGSLLTGRPVRGVWFDRSAEYEVRRSGRRIGKYEHSEDVSLALSPLPAWGGLESSEHRERVARIVAEIARETRRRCRASGKPPMGARRILRLHPHARPKSLQRSPAPAFHAQLIRVRRKMEAAYAAFVDQYRRAATKLVAGATDAAFPPWSFPPRLPFSRARSPELAMA